MDNDVIIQIDNLSKVYKIFDKPSDRVKEVLNPFGKRYSKDFYALNNVSFSVKKGETLGIIGRNGAGKSTLLKIITGVLTPSSGSVKVNGRIASLLELGAGFNPEMTGIENIYMNGTVMGYSKEEMDKRLDNIISFADIGDFINQPVKMYSSGMFARLAFAVNAFVEPDVLIVDEALSVGDVAFQAKCITQMKHMMEAGVTILFVTHDISIIKSFCTKCIYLEKGSIKIQGTAESVADNYLRKIRDDMNKDNIQNTQKVINRYFENKKLTTQINFEENPNFAKRIEKFRQGNGTVKIMNFEVLDEQYIPVLTAEFNQLIRLRIHLKFFENAEVGIGYHIRDDKNIEIIGSSLRLESGKILNGKKDDIYVVDFITRVPLIEGQYNILLVVSTPIDEEGNSVIFNDLIENAYIFKVNRRSDIRIWNKVYIPIDYKINYLGNRNKYIKKCACCDRVVEKYLPIPDYYNNEKKKYNVTIISNPEMVNTIEYSCPYCGAADRERAYALWMDRELDKDKKIKILDIAPALPLKNFIKRKFPKAEYKTGDLFMPGVDYKLDIMNMVQIEDNSVDCFICSHVLEHVPDDIKAMRELKRILKSNGQGILVVPINLNIKEIDEDPDCTDIGERWRRFGQEDHIRAYSRQGFIDRLCKIGFKVKQCRKDYFGEQAMKENALLDTSTVYIVSKEG